MQYQNINAIEAKQWLSDGEAIFIDVREIAEFNNKHIDGAYLSPLGKISNQNLPQTDKKIIIYCQKGARGKSACLKLNKKDNANIVYNLEGGIEAWEQAGFHVVSTKSSAMSLDRQVQLTIGLLVLLSSMTSYYLSPVFIFISAFLGICLIFAGVTGTCGLVVLLAKMPWNQKRA